MYSFIFLTNIFFMFNLRKQKVLIKRVYMKYLHVQSQATQEK